MKAVLIVVVGVLVCACSKKVPPPRNEFEAFERKFVAEGKLLAEAMRREGRDVPDIATSYRAVFIGPSGVFVDRKLVATLAELDTKRAEIVAAIDANSKLLPTLGWSPTTTLDLSTEPASVAISAFRLLAGREMAFYVRYDDPQSASRSMCGNDMRPEDPAAKKDVPKLSVLLDEGRIWVGLSKLEEYQEIPDVQATGRDFEKLETVLKEHKSGLFAERSDLELSAGVATSRDVITAYEIACKVGFITVDVLPREQLSAVPKL